MPREYDNIWDALEVKPSKSANMKIRSKLMVEISSFVEDSGLTQSEAAKELDTTQPRLNDVLKGRIEKCTVDQLVNMLASVGYKVDLTVSDAT